MIAVTHKLRSACKNETSFLLFFFGWNGCEKGAYPVNEYVNTCNQSAYATWRLFYEITHIFNLSGARFFSGGPSQFDQIAIYPQIFQLPFSCYTSVNRKNYGLPHFTKSHSLPTSFPIYLITSNSWPTIMRPSRWPASLLNVRSC